MHQPESKKRSILRNLWQIVHHYQWLCLLGTVILVVAFAADAFLALIIRDIIDIYPRLPGRYTDLLVGLCLGLAAGTLVVRLLKVSATILFNYAGQKGMQSTRTTFWQTLLRVQHDEYMKLDQGSIIRRILELFTVQPSEVSSILSTIAWNVSSILTVLVMMGILNIYLALLGGGFMLLTTILLLLCRHFSTTSQRVLKQAQESLANFLYGWSSPLGILLLKLVDPTQLTERYTALNQAFTNASLRNSQIQRIADFLLSGFAFSLFPAAVYLWGGLQIASDLRSTGAILGLVVAFLSLHGSLTSNISLLLGLWERTQKVQVPLEGHAEFTTLPLEPKGGIKPLLGSVCITVRNVTFAYDSAKASEVPVDALQGKKALPALKNVSLMIEAGQKVAIIGRTGSGKTSLGNLLQKLYKPQQGCILINGTPLDEIDAQYWRRHIAVLGQDPLIIEDTVRENIAYLEPHATQEQIEAAAQGASIHDYIMSLPQGYDTVISQYIRSGGQRQRIALARVLLRVQLQNVFLVLLDEPTNSVDHDTERLIQKALDQLLQGRTAIVITHRLNTIRDADMIVVFDNSEIIECGTHQELLAQNGWYARAVRGEEDHSSDMLPSRTISLEVIPTEGWHVGQWSTSAELDYRESERRMWRSMEQRLLERELPAPKPASTATSAESMGDEFKHLAQWIESMATLKR